MSDSTLYLYTSLTAGSSHIVTATARLETILKANKIPFRAIDVATDDAARKLWGRRSKGKKLPGLVKFGTVVGDLEDIEEWNEYGELRMHIDSVEDFDSIPATSYPLSTSQTNTGSATPATPQPPAQSATPKQSTIKIQSPPAKEQKDDSVTLALRQAGAEAAAKAKGNTSADVKKDNTSADSEQQKGEPPSSGENKEGEETVRRHSVVPAEIVGGCGGRPPLRVPECAAESSADFRADNAEALGLVQHHRGSIVSATSPEEMEKVAQDLRKSISGGHEEILAALKNEHAERAGQDETIVEESDGEDDKTDEKTHRKETQKQDIKDAPKATSTIED
ncbi:hypothetical protein CNMCM8812_005003 [Aspergillus fumigatus]|nr:hypothetical protein CNMCM8812_005003 [Aspergillus fumigatus]KMK61509.1 hypothetical protein Y699_02350 [Aspergillus fumigatus Z5]KAH1300082.1 hypothetical protein KXX11_005711 [Aspergillus fumigatus]KAH1544995.1 hypothetical protein KXX57_005106 [Aspergillus fumigatus]KAH1560491.1 hypothetical protein KXX17_005522 [Aspergillus fumigatus]